MTEKKIINIALLGNPNSGKTSLFNCLTGLNQKVGNFPGVTVDKKTGIYGFEGQQFKVIDLPGTYSIYPKSLDEQVVSNVLLDEANPDYPDVIVVVVDSTNLKRNLLLFTQIYDLQIPMVLALNMEDELAKKHIVMDTESLQKELNDIGLVQISARQHTGIDKLKRAIKNVKLRSGNSIYSVQSLEKGLVKDVKQIAAVKEDYVALLITHLCDVLRFLPELQKDEIRGRVIKDQFDSNLHQVDETLQRYKWIEGLLPKVYARKDESKPNLASSKLDNILTHKVWGLSIFLIILFLIFQGIFTWATYPMDMIDMGINWLNNSLKNIMPVAWYTDLLTDGLISGLGGVVIFIPQIAILFAFIAIMEETGYMARVTFMMDRFCRFFGLNGRSVVPMISSVACAVPAIMTTRGIDNWKERLITILVSPFISCSARLPVYTLLIAISIPEKTYYGLINLQGLVMFGLYLLGTLGALFTAFLLKLLIKSSNRSFFIMELPAYRMPRFKNVGYTIIQKVSAFVYGAGKIIVAISVVLWFLASYGQGERYNEYKVNIQQAFDKGYMTPQERDNLLDSKKLEESYAGKFGKLMEPVIEPLGFDWKVGIAILTSFAAREVFVGTMATIYSVGEGADDRTLKERLKSTVNPETGKPFFSLPVSMSLLVFYVFAMQCMSTLAVVKRETKSWKWPIVQLLYMTGLAYILSLITYNILR